MPYLGRDPVLLELHKESLPFHQRSLLLLCLSRIFRVDYPIEWHTICRSIMIIVISDQFENSFLPGMTSVSCDGFLGRLRRIRSRCVRSELRCKLSFRDGMKSAKNEWRGSSPGVTHCDQFLSAANRIQLGAHSLLLGFSREVIACWWDSIRSLQI